MNIAHYYENYWSETGFNPRNVRLPTPVNTLLKQAAFPNASCLDIGCGNGNKVIQWVSSSQIKYTGVDISQGAVSAARSLGLHAIPIEDSSQLPFPDESFDMVISFEVLEHLFNPLDALREAHRLLKPGGTIVVTVPNTAFIRFRLQLLRGTWNPFGDNRSIQEPWRDPHLRFFTTKSLRSILESAGFTVQSVGGHFDNRQRPSRSLAGLLAGNRLFDLSQRLVPSLLGVRLHAVAIKAA